MKPADNVIVCPNCGDGQKIIDVESGELICTKCGFVIHERVGDEHEGWSILTSEPSSKLRTSPTSLARSDMGLNHYWQARQECWKWPQCSYAFNL